MDSLEAVYYYVHNDHTSTLIGNAASLYSEAFSRERNKKRREYFRLMANILVDCENKVAELEYAATKDRVDNRLSKNYYRLY